MPPLIAAVVSGTELIPGIFSRSLV